MFQTCVAISCAEVFEALSCFVSTKSGLGQCRKNFFHKDRGNLKVGLFNVFDKKTL